MYNFFNVRIKWNNMDEYMDYGILLKLSHNNHVHAYFQDSPRFKDAIDNILKNYEHKHLSNDLAKIISLTSRVRNTSIAETTQNLFNKQLETILKTIENGGFVYINKKGGMIPIDNGNMAIIKEESISNNDKLIWPTTEHEEKNIRIKVWDGGKHYYAYVGDANIYLWNEKTQEYDVKWDSWNEAYEAAEQFIEKNKNE